MRIKSRDIVALFGDGAAVRSTVARPVLVAMLTLLAANIGVVQAADVPTPVKSPLSIEDSLTAFRLAPDLKIEIVAAEPEVVSPVSIAFDEEGRLWVVEMSDYPNGPVPGELPKSRIKLLEDHDADGRFETAHIFADKLLFATGVQPWRGGVIVTLAGEIAYFKDTDGDHRADVRETWYRGFVQENPQLRANHPRFALDNHIYVANGLKGGTIAADREKWGRDISPVNISGKDFRFDPFTGECEAVSGNGQFGLTFDDFGNRFVCTNRNPCRHVVLEDRYLKRNPFLAVRDVCQDVSPPAEKSRTYPISRAWTTSNLHAGQFTAACGLLIYRGDRLPLRFDRNSFVCEPTGNLVHRDILKPTATTFTSSYGPGRAEFLASSDEWFRPVDLANGPDGAFYVVDMYRAVIEHPEWVPAELKNRPDLYEGSDRGRIYRIVSKDREIEGDRRGRLGLAALSTAQLVPVLKHTNAWQRETAARLLFEKQDITAADPLRQMARARIGEASRILALHLLRGLGSLTDDVLTDVVMEVPDDGDPGVRIRVRRLQQHAIALIEERLRASEELREGLLLRLAWVTEGSFPGTDLASAGFQAALSLGEIELTQEALEILAGLLLAGSDDPWMRLAVLSSSGRATHLVVQEILRLINGRDRDTEIPDEADRVARYPLVLREAFEVVGANRDLDAMSATFATLVAMYSANRSGAWTARTLAALNGLGRGIVRRGGSFQGALAQMEQREKDLLADMKLVFEEAAKISGDPNARPELRAEAISVLQFAPLDVARRILFEVARSDSSQEFRLLAIDALATFDDPTVAASLLNDFSSQTPAIRRRVLAALLRNADRIKFLFAEIEAGRMQVSALDPAQVQALINHKDESIRDQARQLLAGAIPADRKQVLEAYQPALAVKADPRRGRTVFEKNCVTCHKIGDLGIDVAPDISDSRTKTPAQLLNDILNPNQAIDSNYVSYTVVTKDGKAETGTIATETSASITLRQPEGKTVLVLRQEIEELKSNGVSLMPEGLEKDITVEQMADLISFIKNWRYLDGAVPLGK